MQTAPSGASTCPTCGGLLDETPGGGLRCMFCLMHAGIGSEEEAAKDSSQDSLKGAMRFGVYEIDCHADGSLCELGRGAMGVTYRATDTSLQRKVALKIIKTGIAERSADARERFVREARAAAALRHEHIATVYQFGMRLETGQYFYAMELIEGETLDERVHRSGPLDTRSTIGIAQQVTSALAAAEKHGLVHRDLKPANLMLVEAAPSPLSSSNDTAPKSWNPPGKSATRASRLQVKIIDFGLAKAFDTTTDPKSLTHDRFVGTPAFASPEQFEHSALDVRSDIYSLGETLWFALTGKTPFAGYGVEDIHRAQRSNVLPLEQLKAAHVPSRLRCLLESMLALEPASRPGTHELAARLQRCSPEAGSARRTRLALAAAALVVLGMFALFVFEPSRIQNAAFDPAPDKSIAVLPFENRSEDKANAYFAEGIQDEILTRLSKIADLKVISRTSTQHYKSAPQNLPEIARQLGVAHIVEGSVQKSGDAVRVNVQLIRAANDSHLWGDTFDRKLTDIFLVESEVAKAIAEQLRAHLSGQEEQVIAAKPTNNSEAYNAYLRGLAYSLKTLPTPADTLSAREYLTEAVRLDPTFALAWSLLSYVDARGYISLRLQQAPALCEEAKRAAETALTLQPNLGEAVLAKGFFHYACLKDYDTAVVYLEQARQFLPNSSRIPELLAYVTRRHGQWDRSELFLNEAEKLDPRNVQLIAQHALSYICLRRFPEAVRKLDQVLKIKPDDTDTIALKAAIAQAEGDLPRAAALLASLHPNADDPVALETQIYQAILERRPASVLPRLKEMLDKPDPALGYLNGELRFFLGWAQKVAGDVGSVIGWPANLDVIERRFTDAFQAVEKRVINDDRAHLQQLAGRVAIRVLAGESEAAKSMGEEALPLLEVRLRERPDDTFAMTWLSWVYLALGRNADALRLSRQAADTISIERDALAGPNFQIGLAQIEARAGAPEEAIKRLRHLLSIPAGGAASTVGLKIDPVWDPIRNRPDFQQLLSGPEQIGPNK